VPQEEHKTWGFIECRKRNVRFAKESKPQILRLRPAVRDFAQDDKRTVFASEGKAQA